MKANSKRRNGKNDRAEIGIGTMIVFIAAVIVAAVAAAVLISTAGNLERQASQTGEETTDEVSSNIFIRDTVGNNTNATENIDEVYFYVSLAPGANAVDLTQVIVRWSQDGDLAQLAAADDICDNVNMTALSDGFCVRDVRQVDNEGDPLVLQPGDRVRIEVTLGSDEAIETRSDVDVLFIPETGSPVDGSFSTPATYSGYTYLTLN